MSCVRLIFLVAACCRQLKLELFSSSPRAQRTSEGERPHDPPPLSVKGLLRKPQFEEQLGANQALPKALPRALPKSIPASGLQSLHPAFSGQSRLQVSPPSYVYPWEAQERTEGGARDRDLHSQGPSPRSARSGHSWHSASGCHAQCRSLSQHVASRVNQILLDTCMHVPRIR